MINQDLYILLLELFDELEKEECFINYKKVEKQLLENSEYLSLKKQFDEINEQLITIDYKPFIKEANAKLNIILNKINNLSLYKDYLEIYEVCNNRISEIAKLIFKDIINVNEMMCCACK